MRHCKCGAELLTKAHTCPPCAKIYMVEWRKKQLEKGISKHNVYNYDWRVNNPKKYILKNAAARAKVRGLEFNITIDDFEIPEYCPALGIKLIMQAGKGASDNSPSLDRIDSSKGYIKGNVQVLSWRANNLKSNGTAEEFKKLAEFMNGS